MVPLTGMAQEGGHNPELVEAAERGRTLFDAGQFQEAIDVLEAAYSRFQEPMFLQYIGRCYQELDRHCEAARNYRLFLENGEPSTDVRVQLEAHLTELDEQCRSSYSSEPAQEEPTQPLHDPTETDPTTVVSPPVVPPEQPPPATSGTGHRSTDIAGAVLLGVGGVGAVTGGILWVAALVSYIQLENKPVERTADGPWALSIPGDVLTFTSLALLVSGSVVFAVGRRRAHRRVALGPGPGDGLGLSLGMILGSARR